MNGTKSLAFFSFFTTTGRSTLIENNTSTINATIMIRCHDDFNRMTQTATVEVVGKRDVHRMHVTCMLHASSRCMKPTCYVLVTCLLHVKSMHPSCTYQS